MSRQGEVNKRLTIKKTTVCGAAGVGELGFQIETPRYNEKAACFKALLYVADNTEPIVWVWTTVI